MLDIMRLAKLPTGSLPTANADNEGAIVYDDTTNTFKYSNGSAWVEPSGGGGSISGSGLTNQIVYWSGASTVAGDAGLTYNATTNVLTVQGGIAFGDGSTQSSAAEQYYAWATNTQTAETEGRHFLTSSGMVKLSDGRFFIVGNPAGAGTLTSEIINATGTASVASGVPTAARSGSYRYCLLTGGDVLVVGGTASPTTSETWNPGTGLFTARGACSAVIGGSGIHALNNGNAVVFGGLQTGTYLNTTQIYDAGTGNWSASGNMVVGRAAFGKVVKVAGGTIGKIFVAGGTISGGDQTDTSEMFDGDTGTWTAKASMAVARGDAGVVLMADGKVMYIGGLNNFGNTTLGSVEIYDPVGDTWTTAASLNVPRSGTHAVCLADGRIMIAGGLGPNGDDRIMPVEVYAPADDVWTIEADGFSAGAPKHNIYGADLAILDGVTGFGGVIAVGGVIPNGTNYRREIRQLKPKSLFSILASKTIKDFIDAQGSTPFIWGTNFNTSMTPGKHWIIQSPEPGFSPLFQIHADATATASHPAPFTSIDGLITLGGGATRILGQLFVDGVINGNNLNALDGDTLSLAGQVPDTANQTAISMTSYTELTDSGSRLLSIYNGASSVDPVSFFDIAGNFNGIAVKVDEVNFTDATDLTPQKEPYVVRIGKVQRLNVQNLLDGVTDQIAWDQLHIDTWNQDSGTIPRGFSGGTSTYIAPFPGYYQVDVMLSFLTISASNLWVRTEVRVNGNVSPELSAEQDSTTNQNVFTVTMSGVIFAAAEDVIDVTATPNNGDCDVRGWFSIKHLGI